jgi:PhnB protein
MSHSLSPYLTVKGARAAINFYVAALGAEEMFALVDPSDGRIGHAELKFGTTTIMLSDEYPDFGAIAPETIGGSPVKLHIYVDNVDALFAKAIALGGIEVRPVKDQFFGDRSGMLLDPFGHTWMIATLKEKVSPQDMQKRWNDGMAA